MKPSTSVSARDLERLSAYLDSQLSDSERSALHERLQREAPLALALEELRQVREALRALPPVRLPRNFTLTPEMAGQARPRTSRGFAFAWGSAFATLALAVVAVADLAGGGLMVARQAAPAMQAAELQVAPALTAAPAGPLPRAAADNQTDQSSLGESTALSGAQAGNGATTETASAPLLAQEKSSGPTATPEPVESYRYSAPITPTPIPTTGAEALSTMGGGAESPTPAPPAPQPPMESGATLPTAPAPAVVSPLRLIEAGLALLALGLALAAVLARRVRR